MFYMGSGGNVSSNPKWSNVGYYQRDKGDAATIEVGNVTSGDVAKNNKLRNFKCSNI